MFSKRQTDNQGSRGFFWRTFWHSGWMKPSASWELIPQNIDESPLRKNEETHRSYSNDVLLVRWRLGDAQDGCKSLATYTTRERAPIGYST